MFFNNRKCPCDMPQIDCGPIMEKPIEKCIQRDIVHEVEQDCQFMLYTKYGMNLHT